MCLSQSAHSAEFSGFITAVLNGAYAAKHGEWNETGDIYIPLSVFQPPLTDHLHVGACVSGLREWKSSGRNQWRATLAYAHSSDVSEFDARSVLNAKRKASDPVTQQQSKRLCAQLDAEPLNDALKRQVVDALHGSPEGIQLGVLGSLLYGHGLPKAQAARAKTHVQEEGGITTWLSSFPELDVFQPPGMTSTLCVRLVATRKACRFFAKGNCYNGNKCRQSHEKIPKRSESTLPSNQPTGEALDDQLKSRLVDALRNMADGWMEEGETGNILYGSKVPAHVSADQRQSAKERVKSEGGIHEWIGKYPAVFQFDEPGGRWVKLVRESGHHRQAAGAGTTSSAHATHGAKAASSPHVVTAGASSVADSSGGVGSGSGGAGSSKGAGTSGGGVGSSSSSSRPFTPLLSRASGKHKLVAGSSDRVMMQLELTRALEMTQARQIAKEAQCELIGEPGSAPPTVTFEGEPVALSRAAQLVLDLRSSAKDGAPKLTLTADSKQIDLIFGPSNVGLRELKEETECPITISQKSERGLRQLHLGGVGGAKVAARGRIVSAVCRLAEVWQQGGLYYSTALPAPPAATVQPVIMAATAGAEEQLKREARLSRFSTPAKPPLPVPRPHAPASVPAPAPTVRPYAAPQSAQPCALASAPSSSPSFGAAGTSTCFPPHEHAPSMPMPCSTHAPTSEPSMTEQSDASAADSSMMHGCIEAVVAQEASALGQKNAALVERVAQLEKEMKRRELEDEASMLKQFEKQVHAKHSRTVYDAIHP